MERDHGEPGTRIGYHAITWGYVVGEIIRRATGKPIPQLHGDVHPGNLIAARGGEMVWIDFEDVCLDRPSGTLPR